MLKNLMYVHMLGYDMIVSDEGEGQTVRALTETEDFPYLPTKEEATEFLNTVEDDSSWMIIDRTTLFNMLSETEIIATVEKEI